MGIIEINETHEFDDGSIEVKYEGIPLKEDINEKEVRRMVRDFIDNHKYDNMLENVIILSTYFFKFFL